MQNALSKMNERMNENSQIEIYDNISFPNLASSRVPLTFHTHANSMYLCFRFQEKLLHRIFYLKLSVSSTATKWKQLVLIKSSRKCSPITKSLVFLLFLKMLSASMSHLICCRASYSCHASEALKKEQARKDSYNGLHHWRSCLTISG